MKSDLIISKPEKRTREQLKRLQALPLIQKENLSKRRIKQFYTEMNGKIYVAFSGGKDSTVLLHLVRSVFPDEIIVAVFCNTGLEYPEIIDFIKTVDNVFYLFPKMSFVKILKKYGYPVISKPVSMAIDRYMNTKSDIQKQLRIEGGINPTSGKKQYRTIPISWQWALSAPFKISDKCCDIMKKNPSKKFEKETGLHPILGLMASESKKRQEYWEEHGCNAFDIKEPKSNPLMFWTDLDIWEYIKKYNIPYSKIYDMGEVRTGCMFCLYGCQYDDEGGRKRFDRMKINHPKQYKACENLGVIDVLHYLDRKLGRDQLELFVIPDPD